MNYLVVFQALVKKCNGNCEYQGVGSSVLGAPSSHLSNYKMQLTGKLGAVRRNYFVVK